jgi:diketogulonate reductase-like aldo/keto reductase
VTDQVQYHPYVDQRDLLSVCREHDLALTAYSPLAQGAVLTDDTLTAIGDRYDKSPAQVTLRWLLQQENVVAIPRSSTPAHVEANAEVFDFALTDDEMAELHDLTGGIRMRIQNALPALVRSLPL